MVKIHDGNRERTTRLKAKINLVRDFLETIDISSNELVMTGKNKLLVRAIEAALGFKLDLDDTKNRSLTLDLTSTLRNPFLKKIKIDLGQYRPYDAATINGKLKDLLDLKVDEAEIAVKYNILYALLDVLQPKYRNSSDNAKNYLTLGQFALEKVPWARLSDLLDTLLTLSNLFDISNEKINWEKPIDAYIISIKIIGIHDLLSEAKKMRELYINSFLISLLVWLVAEEFVRDLGGDILLFPNVRRTPLFGMLIKKGAESKGNKFDAKLIEYAKEITFYSVYEKSYGYPIFATIPGEVILILPKNIIRTYLDPNKNNITIDDVLDVFDKKMQNIQKRIIRLAQKYFLRYIKDLDYYENTAFCDNPIKDKQDLNARSASIKALRRFAEFVCRAITIAKKYGFFDASLLDYSINVLEIGISKTNEGKDKLIPNFRSNLCMKAKRLIHKFDCSRISSLTKKCRRVNNSKLSPIDLIDIVFECLEETIWSNEFKQLFSSPSPEETYAITKYSRDIYEDKVNYFPEFYRASRHHHCSVCGRRPAVFGLPPYRKQWEHSPLYYEETVPWILQPYFDAREHLCAHCLIKRILIIPEVFKRTFGEVLGIRISPLPKFISTTHLAIMSNTLSFIEQKNFRLLKNIKKKIDTLSSQGAYDDISYILRKRTIISNAWKKYGFSHRFSLYPLFIRNFYKKIERKGEDIRKGFIYLIEIPEYELAKIGIKQFSNIDVNNYVALLYGDGDNFGKFIQLKFSGKKERTPIGDLNRDLIKDRVFGCQFAEHSLLYYRTISHAVSVSSGIEQALFLRGAKKIIYENGRDFSIPLVIPVLFGGDDVILFTTVDDAFWIYEFLRKIFTNGIRDEQGEIIVNDYSTKGNSTTGSSVGFNVYRGLVTHAFPHLVRSIHIAFIHHKYPLGRAVLGTIYGLDAKDDIKIEFPNGVSKKDVLIVSFFGRGNIDVAILPISLMDQCGARYTIITKERSSIDLLLELYKNVFGDSRDKKLSLSFLYDIFAFDELKFVLDRKDKLSKELRLYLFNLILKRNFIDGNSYPKNLGLSDKYISYLFDTALEVDLDSDVIVSSINEVALTYGYILREIYGKPSASALLEIIRSLVIYKNAKKTIKLKELIGE